MLLSKLVAAHITTLTLYIFIPWIFVYSLRFPYQIVQLVAALAPAVYFYLVSRYFVFATKVSNNNALLDPAARAYLSDK